MNIDGPAQHLASRKAATFFGACLSRSTLGVVAFFAYLILQNRELQAGRWLLIAMPAWLLVGLRAAISINIPRHNLPLIAIYASSLDWMLERIWFKVTGRLE